MAISEGGRWQSRRSKGPRGRYDPRSRCLDGFGLYMEGDSGGKCSIGIGAVVDLDAFTIADRFKVAQASKLHWNPSLKRGEARGTDDDAFTYHMLCYSIMDASKPCMLGQTPGRVAMPLTSPLRNTLTFRKISSDCAGGVFGFRPVCTECKIYSQREPLSDGIDCSPSLATPPRGSSARPLEH